MSARTASFVGRCEKCPEVWYHPSDPYSLCPGCNPNYRSTCSKCETIWYHAELKPTICPGCHPIRFRHVHQSAEPTFDEIWFNLGVWLYNLDLISYNIAETGVFRARKNLIQAQKAFIKAQMKVEENFKDPFYNKTA